MLLRDYVVGLFLKRLLTFSLLASLFTVLIQLLQTAHLVFALPFKLSATYLILLLFYSFILGLGFSLPVAVASTLLTLKEERFFHIIYTFGISHRRVFFYLLTAVLLLASAGMAASPFVNYQKISLLVKYLRFKFGESVLLTVPSRTFVNLENLSVYFERREGKYFDHFLAKAGDDLITAKAAELGKGGLLTLRDSSIFTRWGKYALLIRAKTYYLGMAERYSHPMNRKKLRKETAFGVAVFAFALLIFPLLFYLLLFGNLSRTKVYLLAFGFVVLQFATALAVKAVVK